MSNKCDCGFNGVIFVSRYLVKKYGVEEAIRKSIVRRNSKYKSFKITLADPSVFNQEIKL
jgi:hypothetical protein